MSRDSTMPPRRFVIAIAVGWLLALGWLAWDRWVVRLLADDCPALTRDISDAVAPRDVSWILTRQGRKVGTADGRMAPRSDKNYDLSNRARELEFLLGPVELRMTIFHVTRTVTPENKLVALAGKATMTVRYLNREEQKVETKLVARVVAGGCEWEHEIAFGAGEPVRVTYRTELPAAAAFVPLDPVQKYPGLRPGQTWLVSLIDPVTEVGTVVMGLALKNELGFSAPRGEPATELLARVADAAEVIDVQKVSYTCRVVEFTAKGVSAKVWVNETDDTVVRQEATVFGQVIRMTRE